MLKVLMVNCSPRYKSFSKIYAEKFIMKLTENAKKQQVIDISIETLKLFDYKLNYCIGKMSCFKVGKCPLDKKDDMGIINNYFETYDHFVFIIPVYSHNVPGLVKTLFDRWSYNEHFFGFAGKKISLIIQGDSNGTDETIEYVSKIFLTLGFQLINCSGITMLELTQNQHLLDEILAEHVDSLLSSYQNNEIVVDDYQETLFRVLRNIVLAQDKRGYPSYKVMKWDQLQTYDSFYEYLSQQARMKDEEHIK